MASKIKDPPIALTVDGFTAGDHAVLWSEISSVSAYKLDLITYDDFRLVIDFDNPPNRLDLSEECPGFQEFIQALESQFRFPPNWWSTVAFPAFKTNETLLYRRA